MEFKPLLYSRCSEITLLDEGVRFVSESPHTSKKAGDIVMMPPAR